MEVHHMPTATATQHYHTPTNQHIYGHGGADALYQSGGVAYAPPHPQPQQQCDGRYGVGTTIKSEYATADESPDVSRSPKMGAALVLKREAHGGEELNDSGLYREFTVMRDTSNLPLNVFGHFGQHSQAHYVPNCSADALIDELYGASSTPPSACSSSASVASSKDASISTYAMPAGAYADLPTTSAVSAAFVDRKRPYPCTLCPSKFGSKMELEEHQNSHTGMKPFQCDVCQSRFNRRSTLWNHKRIHSDAKPFVCTVCQMTFKWKNSLKCHKEMHYRKNETTSIQDNDILTYATAAKKQMRLSNSVGGRSSALHFGGARKHQRSISTSLTNPAGPLVETPKKLSVPNTIITAPIVDSNTTVGEFSQSVIRHPYGYMTQQQRQQNHYKLQKQQLNPNNNESKSVIHNNNNNNDNISDSNSCSCSDSGGLANFNRGSVSTAPSAKSGCEEPMCGAMSTLSHHYSQQQQQQQQFFSSLENCNAELNHFDFQRHNSLGGTIPTYDEAFLNGYPVLNPTLLSVAAAAAINYSEVGHLTDGGIVDQFSYGNAGAAVYGGLLHENGKLFDIVPPPMSVIQDGAGGAFAAHLPPAAETTATALVHEGGYLNYG